MTSAAIRLTIASMLLWSMGFLLLVLTVVVTLPVYFLDHHDAALIDGVVQLIWVAVNGVAAVALYRKKRKVRWWAAGICAVSILYNLLMPIYILAVGVTLNLAALVLIVLPWDAEETASDVGDHKPATSKG